MNRQIFFSPHFCSLNSLAFIPWAMGVAATMWVRPATSSVAASHRHELSVNCCTLLSPCSSSEPAMPCHAMPPSRDAAGRIDLRHHKDSEKTLENNLQEYLLQAQNAFLRAPSGTNCKCSTVQECVFRCTVKNLKENVAWIYRGENKSVGNKNLLWEIFEPFLQSKCHQRKNSYITPTNNPSFQTQSTPV